MVENTDVSMSMTLGLWLLIQMQRLRKLTSDRSVLSLPASEIVTMIMTTNIKRLCIPPFITFGQRRGMTYAYRPQANLQLNI